MAEIDTQLAVAADVICLRFTDPVAVTPAYYDPASYAVTRVGDPAPLTVLDVLPVLGHQSQLVYLHVRPLVSGVRYQAAIAGNVLYTTQGVAIPACQVRWTQHRTKTDSVVGSMAAWYDLRSRSNLRGVVEAITISDEQIGGDF